MSKQMLSLCWAAMARLPQGTFLARAKTSIIHFRCSQKSRAQPSALGLVDFGFFYLSLLPSLGTGRAGRALQEQRVSPAGPSPLSGLYLTAGWALQHGQHSFGESHSGVISWEKETLPLSLPLPGDRALPAAFTGWVWFVCNKIVYWKVL